VTVVVGVALVIAVSAQPSPMKYSATSVRITYVTPTVSPGGVLAVRATTPQGAACGGLLSPPSGTARTSLVLPNHIALGGRTAWSRQIPTGAPAGRWRVFLRCSPGGSASRSFTVGTLVTPAQIVVSKSGFSVDTFGGETFLNCGLALQNRSSGTDARNVTVTVQFADTLGRSLTSDQITVTVIPAGQTFYAGCLATSNVTLTVASLKVTVTVGKSVAKAAQLPPVSGLTLTSDPFFDTQTLTGNFTNPYSKAMPEDAEINAVYFDPSGNIIGGDSTRAGASVQPGATVGFEFPDLAANVASAKVSVDPCGEASIFGGCHVP